jgi:hypothetical protein
MKRRSLVRISPSLLCGHVKKKKKRKGNEHFEYILVFCVFFGLFLVHLDDFEIVLGLF